MKKHYTASAPKSIAGRNGPFWKSGKWLFTPGRAKRMSERGTAGRWLGPNNKLKEALLQSHLGRTTLAKPPLGDRGSKKGKHKHAPLANAKITNNRSKCKSYANNLNKWRPMQNTLTVVYHLFTVPWRHRASDDDSRLVIVFAEITGTAALFLLEDAIEVA